MIIPGLFTLIGAALGAWLAGKYAVKSVKEQILYDKRKSELKEIEDFLKLNDSYILEYHHSITFANELLDAIKNNSELGKNKVHIIQNNIEVLEESLKSLRNLPILEYSPSDVYIFYRGNLSVIDSIIKLSKGYLGNMDESNKDYYTKHLAEWIRMLTETKDTLEEYVSKKREEYKSLTK